MALSPNYSWAEPDNSSLVKNGASDIRTLGDAIDTSVWNVGFGQAGKNKIINGDLKINQRNFVSFNPSNAGVDQYTFDRFFTNTAGGTATVSPQTFTAGTAPVAGYEGTNFLRCVTTSQSGTSDYFTFGQKIEDVRTFANQTVTISFWAKASTGTPLIGISVVQNFGSGGSASVITSLGTKTISASWVRYSATVPVPSISGKTIGTSSFLNVGLWTSAGTVISGLGYPAVGLQNITADFWGIQIEYGSKATPFQTATGTIQGELAACQRYYQRFGGYTAFENIGQGSASSATRGQIKVCLPVTMRTSATSVDYSTLNLSDGVSGFAVTAVTIDQAGKNLIAIFADVASGLTQYRNYFIYANNSTSAYLGFSAEL